MHLPSNHFSLVNDPSKVLSCSSLLHDEKVVAVNLSPGSAALHLSPEPIAPAVASPLSGLAKCSALWLRKWPLHVCVATG